jgi:integrase
MARDRVRRNVVELAELPTGQLGRPSKALSAQQADDVLIKTAVDRLHPYIVVSLLTGARTEELRALRWDHLHLEGRAGAIRRSIRTSRYSAPCGRLVIPRLDAQGERLRYPVGASMRSGHVSLSDAGVPVEMISQLVGHRGTSVTNIVYRHQIRPVIQTGATVVDELFGPAGDAR